MTIFLLAGCTEANNNAPENATEKNSPIILKTVSSQQEDFKVVVLAEDLVHPWSLEFLPGGGYLVSERRGRLWMLDRQQGIKKEITGLPEIYHKGQGGLLDIALHPGFRHNGWLYFSYAAPSAQKKELANTEVARVRLPLDQLRPGTTARVSADPYDLTALDVIFKAAPKVKGDNHWGSRLLFTEDEMLFITLGERFDYKEEAQNTANHLGSIVRLKPDGSVPADNPFTEDKSKRPEIYSFGHRNVQGIAIHPETGEIWIHEHGPKGGDEINILQAGGNYGWPEVTYGISYWGFEISDKTSAPGMIDPVLQWTPSIAPSGMVFYTGDKFPAWQGDLFVGSLAHRHLRRVELAGNKVTEQEELLKGLGYRIRDVRVGPDGYLYVLTDEEDGMLLRLEPVSVQPADTKKTEYNGNKMK